VSTIGTSNPYRRAVNLWGVDNQLNKTTEECQELIEAIDIHRFMTDNDDTWWDILEEAVDVYIMVRQIKEIFGEADFSKMLELKMNKFQHYMDNPKKYLNSINAEKGENMCDKTVWRFPLRLTDEQVIQVPKDAEILCVKNQEGSLQIYAEVERDTLSFDHYTIYILGTGRDKTFNATYLDTVLMADGDLVWHIYYSRFAPE